MIKQTRQKSYVDRQREKKLTRVEVWVPIGKEEVIRSRAKALRKAFLKVVN